MSFVLPAVLSPNWDPGTSELRSQDLFCGLVHVETERVRQSAVGYHSYDAIEHLIFVVSAGGTGMQIAYPKVIPAHPTSTTSTTSTPPCPAHMTVHVAKAQDDGRSFVTRVREVLEGCQIAYVVGGMDYYVGRPRVKTGKDGPSLVHVDALSAVYPTGADPETVQGWSGAEELHGGVFLVHQVMPFRMHLGRADASTQCPSALPAGVLVRDLFAGLDPAHRVWLYSRGYATEVWRGRAEDFPFLAEAPPRGRTIDEDFIEGLIGIEPPLLP